MAIVRKLEPIHLERDSKHSEVDCTYSVVEDDKGNKYLQIDTYGSATRKIPGEKRPIHSIQPRSLQTVERNIREIFLKSI